VLQLELEQVAGAYANALVEVAQKTNSLEAVHADVDALASVLKDNAVRRRPAAAPSLRRAACLPSSQRRWRHQRLCSTPAPAGMEGRAVLSHADVRAVDASTAPPDPRRWSAGGAGAAVQPGD
jgi:hypothetical protein